MIHPPTPFLHRTESELLRQCAASGQVSAPQMHQHHQAGELRVEDMTPAAVSLARLMLEIADEAARTDVECKARWVGQGAGGPVYDTSTLETDVVNDPEIRASNVADVTRAVKYLDLRGLLHRPVAGYPNIVSFFPGTLKGTA